MVRNLKEKILKLEIKCLGFVSGALAFPNLSQVSFSDRGELSKVSSLLTFLESDSKFDRKKTGQKNPLKLLKDADLSADALYTL